jgi:hypothetical protein
VSGPLPAVEVLQFRIESHRAKGWLTTMAEGARAAGLLVQRTLQYRGIAPWLVLWGPGAPERAEVMRAHVANGGRVIALDLAYWNRDRKVRVAIDAAHPWPLVMRRDRPTDRFAANPAPIADRWNPDGPIILAGLGDKARVQYGAGLIDAWEARMMQACRDRWPGRAIRYRRKRTGAHVPTGATLAPDTPIDQVLAGASLVITWHSNVAVDAIRLGIPVICRDGAAAAVCPSELGPDDPRPLEPALRDRFLANLAWFQWAPEEGAACWAFLKEILA